METFGKFCFGIIALVASSLFNGFVFMQLWGWFIAPTFNTMYLTLIQCMGVSFFITFILSKPQGKGTTASELAELLALGLIQGCLVLLLGWGLHLFY